MTKFKGKERQMPYPQGHREETRTNIVRAARKLFNREGFHNVSIDQIMADAGLTRGGFYSYFASKDELYAEAITFILFEHPSEHWEGVDMDKEGPALAREIVTSYLGQAHFDDVDGTCPLVAQPNDVSRGGDKLRGAFETVLRAMLGIFETGNAPENHTNREAALATAVLCVGGMVLSRSVASPELGDEIRAAAMKFGLEIGGWDRDYDA